MSRRICVITGTRAEYGLLCPILKRLRNSHGIELQLLVTGMHLSPEFGLTYRQIEDDGFEITDKVEMLLSSDSPIGVSKAMGLGMISFSESYARLKPDLIIGLGDRFELLSAAAAAMMAGIPIAHLYGGESTEGLVDEAIRHAISKMSHLHFTSTDIYRKRVVQLGEHPDRVFNVGALGVENIKNLTLLSKTVLEEEVGFEISFPTVLVTYHPVTLENSSSAEQFSPLLEALDSVPELKVVFTRPNADTYGRIINSMIDGFVLAHPRRSVAFTSLGTLKYLSLMNVVDGIVGNSSSGIIEAPSLHRGSVNIGDRQRGRVKADSVLDCEPTKLSIANALGSLLSDQFRAKVMNVMNPYEGGNTSSEIVRIVTTTNLEGIVKKKFYDIDFYL